MANALNWFEIPATDIERARAFYNTVLGIEMIKMPMKMEGFAMYAFTLDEGSVGGGIMQGEGYQPCTDGSIIYLNAGESLAAPVGRIEGAGGKVLMPKIPIGENGFVAFFMDPEGNKGFLEVRNPAVGHDYSPFPISRRRRTLNFWASPRTMQARGT